MTRKSRRLSLIFAFLALVLGSQEAKASSTATLNIDVTIVANLSVEISSASSSTQVITWNTANSSQAFANNTISTSAILVLNNSGAQTEQWALSADTNSIDVSGMAPNETWNLSTSSAPPGVNSFSVQAVFGSSSTVANGCPAPGASDWQNGTSAPLLTTTPVTYTSTVFADSALNNHGSYQPDSGNDLYAGSIRALCWQIVMPSSTNTTHEQNIQIIVTAQSP